MSLCLRPTSTLYYFTLLTPKQILHMPIQNIHNTAFKGALATFSLHWPHTKKIHLHNCETLIEGRGQWPGRGPPMWCSVA